MKLQRWVQFAIAACVSVPALAGDGSSLSAIGEAAKRSGDKSRQALVSIFGDVVNNPLAIAGGGSDTILANLFQVTNAGLLVIGGIFACYVWWHQLSQVAHEGTVFGKSQTTMWGPVRLVWGIASLVPTANGWALSQLLMLWAASLFGVGIANLGTDAAVAAFNNGKGMIVQPAMPDTVSLARSVLEADLCMHSMNAGQALAVANGGFSYAGEYVQQFSTASGFILRSPSQGKICGGAGLDAKLLEATPQGVQWFGSSIDTSPIYRAHLTALNRMQQFLSQEALAFVNASMSQLNGMDTQLPDMSIAIQRAALAYEASVNQEAGLKAGSIGDLAAKLSDRIKDGGWWTLGAWYQTFAHANSKLSNAVAAKAQTYGEGFAGDQGVSSVRVAVQKLYRTQQANDTNAVALGQTTSVTNTDTSKFLGSIFEKPGQKIVYYMVNLDVGSGGGGTTNPLIKMKNLGDYTLISAEAATVTYVGVKAAASVAEGVNAVAVVTNVVTGAGNAIAGAVEAATPFFLMIIIPVFLIGAGLSIYLPLIPFIMWFGAIINWLVVVLEAIIAAPLWAITHLSGEGDGMGAKSAHGYIFLLNVMARPMLMVIGFFGGGAILVVGGTFLNEIFGIAIANIQFDSITGLVSMVALLFVYFAICLTLIHSCFNLIFIVPDQVINWVGGTASPVVGRDTNDAVKSSVNVLMSRLEHMRKGAPPDSGTRHKSGNGIKR
ncbi:DotA/TraY family protein [Massilia atriviolacea]|uniref:DotA/TraY family protein n=1 Tax=Massilia atriviolacea TaxID=2495579 RepID=UPI0013DF2F5E|nr:DotA/TraY family protein [Massilia atriviolacea]